MALLLALVVALVVLLVVLLALSASLPTGLACGAHPTATGRRLHEPVGIYVCTCTYVRLVYMYRRMYDHGTWPPGRQAQAGDGRKPEPTRPERERGRCEPFTLGDGHSLLLPTKTGLSAAAPMGTDDKPARKRPRGSVAPAAGGLA